MHELEDWARTHHGLITFAASKMSSSAWYRAIDSGRLVAVHPHVARLPGAFPTPEQAIAAAVLATAPTGMASHRSAARLWGVPRPDAEPVDVIVPHRGAERTLEGVVVHRPIDDVDVTPQRRVGIRCSNVIRMLCDLGAVDPVGVSDAVGHVLGARLANLTAIEAALQRHARPGRSGVGALRDALAVWTIDAKPADSILEHAMRRLVQRYRLPPVVFHAVVEGWEVDFRVIDTPLILECDGWTSHGMDRRQFERDRRRDAELAAAGWVVLRFTYHAVVREPGRTAERIRAAVARWAPDVALRHH